MTLQLLAVALLCGQLGGAPVDHKANEEKAKPVVRPATVIAKDVQSLIKKEQAAKTFSEREPIVKDMTKLYEEMIVAMRSGSASVLAKDEYRLRQKMVSIVKDLNRKIAKAQAEMNRQTTKVLRNPESYSKSSLEDATIQGGGTISGANNLIQIIITTIDPEGWQVNGGTYVIEYWANGMALVVAAPIDVHEAIGGSLTGMRRAGGP
jgi:hypothetical protein